MFYFDLQQDISRASFSHQIERVLFCASFLCEFFIQVSRASVMGLTLQSTHCFSIPVCYLRAYVVRTSCLGAQDVNG